VEEGRREKGEVGGVTGVPVIDIPFGVNVPVMEAHAAAEDDFPSLFSIGSMNWIPNQEGIRWFLDQVWPDVHAQFPRMKYYLAGREMPLWMKELKRENVMVLGEVDDAPSFMASRSVMIVPLFSGSGIRVKIIEGMAMGKTVISTAIGAEGIRCTNRENILIADTPCEFFEMVSICAGDRSLREKIGQKAKQLVATQYEPTALIKKLVAFYHSLVI
jgi:glycosyltransferase involved in cell wall biosynthesis